MYEDVCSGGCVFRRTGVPETGRDATQVQLHPVMLRTRRTTTVMIRVPMTAGATDRLEFEDPRIVLIIEIFIGDQFNITARLRADQRRSGPLPDEGPVVRIAHPQGRSSRLMAKPGMPLTLRMSARLHALFVPHFTSVEEGSLCPRSASSRSAASIHRGLLRSSTVHRPRQDGHMAGPALNELTPLLGRRVRMCPLTTQVDGEERAAQDEPCGRSAPDHQARRRGILTSCRSVVGAGRR
jgi:hypothetical protein